MMRLILGYVLLFSMAMAGCTDSANQKSVETKDFSTQATAENRLAGQYIVTLRNNASLEILTEVFNEFGISSIKDLSRNRYLIILKQDPGPEEISKLAAATSDIEHVQPNYIYQTLPPIQQKQLLER